MEVLDGRPDCIIEGAGTLDDMRTSTILRLKRVLRSSMTPGSAWADACDRVHRRIWGRLLPWSPNPAKVEVELTSACNLRCANCNRATSLAPDAGYIAASQIDRFVGESLELGWRWERIGLTGGEPTLHPDLPGVVRLLERYKRDHPSCEIAVVTNGHGRAVREALSDLPAWVAVKSSAKTGEALPFEPFNVAPIDHPDARQMRFRLGCSFTEVCGLGLSRYGYYPCGPAAAVDRAFGWDLGIKSLAGVCEKRLRAQMSILCGLCGHFLGNFGAPRTSRQETSGSWQAALRQYDERPPRLEPW
jgi:hypothetical protein